MSRLYRFTESKPAAPVESVRGFTEKDLEDIIEKSPEVVLGERLLLIGRQVRTDTGKILDLLCLDSSGRFVVLELKRGYAPRDVIAQVIDYAAWLNEIPERELEEIARSYFTGKAAEFNTLHNTFEAFFGVKSDGALGHDVVAVVVAEDFPPEVMRAAALLSEKGVPLRCVSFGMFAAGSSRFISVQTVSGGTEEGPDQQVLPGKRADRQAFKELANVLEEMVGGALDSTPGKRTQRFTVRQSRDGRWTTAHTRWKYGDGYLVFCVGLDRADEPGVHFVLSASGRGEAYRRALRMDSVRKVLGRAGYEPENEADGPYYRCVTTETDLGNGKAAYIADLVKRDAQAVLNVLLEAES